MLRYKVFNWGSFVIYYRNITGESIWTEDHLLTMTFEFGPDHWFGQVRWYMRSLVKADWALFHQCRWHTSVIMDLVKLACQKAFCLLIFRQPKQQDERYVESRQNWRSFVSSFAPPPSPPWQTSKNINLLPDKHQKSNQIKYLLHDQDEKE